MTRDCGRIGLSFSDEVAAAISEQLGQVKLERYSDQVSFASVAMQMVADVEIKPYLPAIVKAEVLRVTSSAAGAPAPKALILEGTGPLIVPREESLAFQAEIIEFEGEITRLAGASSLATSTDGYVYTSVLPLTKEIEQLLISRLSGQILIIPWAADPETGD